MSRNLWILPTVGKLFSSWLRPLFDPGGVLVVGNGGREETFPLVLIVVEGRERGTLLPLRRREVMQEAGAGVFLFILLMVLKIPRFGASFLSLPTSLAGARSRDVME